jgi:hypothetical protein
MVSSRCAAGPASHPCRSSQVSALARDPSTHHRGRRRRTVPLHEVARPNPARNESDQRFRCSEGVCSGGRTRTCNQLLNSKTRPSAVPSREGAGRSSPLRVKGDGQSTIRCPDGWPPGDAAEEPAAPVAAQMQVVASLIPRMRRFAPCLYDTTPMRHRTGGRPGRQSHQGAFSFNLRIADRPQCGDKLACADPLENADLCS